MVEKSRRGYVTCTFYIIVLLCFVSIAMGEPNQDAPGPGAESHGTINILLANENGLVAVTDSMLSTPDDRHYPGHQKLFQIDDRTIATMAGSYSRPGLGGQNQHFDLWVPNTMTKFAAQLQVLARSNVSLAFPMKFQRFSELFEEQLTANLQAAIVADPTLNLAQVEPIELTLAGFDLDGSLKIGEVTLTSRLTTNGIVFDVGALPRAGGPIPTCELRGKPDSAVLYDSFHLPKPKVITKGLYCEIAGLIAVQQDGTLALNEGVPEIEKVLDGPIAPTGLTALRDYFASEASGQPLSIDQLIGLARELEGLVAMQEYQTRKFRIGGDRYLAILRNGHVEGAPGKNETRPSSGIALSGPRVFNSGADCTGMRRGTKGFALDPPAEGVQVGIMMTNCDGDIVDGAIYHDSKFINGNLNYSGKGPIHFAATNTVQGTALKLDQSVDLQRGDVRELICKFPWKAVYHGSDQIHFDCK